MINLALNSMSKPKDISTWINEEWVEVNRYKKKCQIIGWLKKKKSKEECIK